MSDDDGIMNCEQWKTMVLDAIREGTLSEEALSWVGDCALSAYEDGEGDEVVFEEIKIREERLRMRVREGEIVWLRSENARLRGELQAYKVLDTAGRINREVHDD